MTEPVKRKPANQELISAVWDEARDLIKRLEGSSVQRFAVEAGDTRIEIERGIPSGIVGRRRRRLPPGRRRTAPQPRSVENRHPILAPLVGTFYRSGQPGANPFVEVGDVVEPGQTVVIVEAMKLMNQVQSDVKGTVSEILVEDGQWVEFEQVLIYLDRRVTEARCSRRS